MLIHFFLETRNIFWDAATRHWFGDEHVAWNTWSGYVPCISCLRFAQQRSWRVFFFPLVNPPYIWYIYNIYISYNIYIIINVLASFLYSMVPLFFAWTKSCEAWFNISTPFCSPSNCCCASVQLTASRASCGQMTGTGIVWCLGLVEQEIYGKSSWIWFVNHPTKWGIYIYIYIEIYIYI